MAPPDPPGPPGSPRPDDALAARRRTVLVTAVGAVLAGALLFAIVARAQRTAVDTGGGPEGATRAVEFDVGNATQRAATVDRSGPILFPDPQGRTRDIFVQHLGGADWVAFEARATGASRRCVLRWEADARHFVDPCDGRVYPPDGAGLVTFPARVNDKDRLIVDLGRPTAPSTP